MRNDWQRNKQRHGTVLNSFNLQQVNLNAYDGSLVTRMKKIPCGIVSLFSQQDDKRAGAWWNGIHSCLKSNRASEIGRAHV